MRHQSSSRLAGRLTKYEVRSLDVEALSPTPPLAARISLNSSLTTSACSSVSSDFIFARSASRRAASARGPRSSSARSARAVPSSPSSTPFSFAASRTPIVLVPLNAMCSNMCARPVRPPGSSTEPTRKRIIPVNTGAVPRWTIRNRMPLSRVRSWTRPSRDCAAAGAAAPSAAARSRAARTARRGRFTAAP